MAPIARVGSVTSALLHLDTDLRIDEVLQRKLRADAQLAACALILHFQHLVQRLNLRELRDAPILVDERIVIEAI